MKKYLTIEELLQDAYIIVHKEELIQYVVEEYNVEDEYLRVRDNDGEGEIIHLCDMHIDNWMVFKTELITLEK